MKFKTPGNQAVMIALLSGHSLTIQPDGSTDVPVIFRKEALARECVPAGMEIEGATPGTVPNRDELLLKAIGKMLDSDDATAFTGDGRPNATKLAEIVGFTVTSKERDTAWAKYQELEAKGDQD